MILSTLLIILNISLIPKVRDPTSQADYRPLSLFESMYKIIAKILAMRLKSVIGDVIIDVQSTFVADRNILDAPLVINEMVSWAKQLKNKIFLLKIDFEKAFDCIN